MASAKNFKQNESSDIIFGQVTIGTASLGAKIKNSSASSSNPSPTPMFNAVDIDWNNAKLPTTSGVVSTTTDLLEHIDGLDKAIIENEAVVASILNNFASSCGFNENGLYKPSSSTPYVGSKQTLADAILALATQLKKVSDKLGV